MKNRIMLGLWRYIINVPPFLWKKQISAGKRKIEKIYGSIPDKYRTIHHFAVRELPYAGEPLTPEFISKRLDLTEDAVKAALDYLEEHMTFLYRNESGNVVWAYPVTVAKTPHKITFSTGEKLYAA
jgi:hypothetical protein